jgi:metal-responsive CopG/Arc/MetJ family transcriptional regulator
MSGARKVKISISIDSTLLATVDRYAAHKGVTRSAVMERWIGQVSHREKLNRLEEETAAYYDALTDAERQDDTAWAETSSKAARKLRIDEAPASSVTGTKRRAPRRRT